MKSWLEVARDASNLSPEDCASAMKCSRATYMSREATPGRLSLDEISRIMPVLSKEGRRVVYRALDNLKV